MPIRVGNLRTLMLRVSPESKVGAALKDVRERPRPHEWLLLYPLAGGYAVWHEVGDPPVRLPQLWHTIKQKFAGQ